MHDKCSKKSILLKRCAKELSALQRQRLPPELKAIVTKKWEALEEKKQV